VQIFVLRYDRREGKLLKLFSFAESERAKAQAQRLALELEIAANRLDQEAVLLEAESERALKFSHARYFEDLDSLAKALKEAS
jgi:hypothetical protein